MIEEMDRETNERLDKVIQTRRTIRSFTDEVPPRRQIEQIIEAGLLAPYAAAALEGVKLFRRFFVFERGGESIAKVAELAIVQLKAVFESFKKLADKKKELHDADLEGLIEDRIEDVVATWEMSAPLLLL